MPQFEAGIACCEYSHHDLPSAQALQNAIDAVKPGVRYREVGDIISHHVGMQGFQVVRSYCGHGICDLFHCAPNLPHYARNKVQRHFLSRILLPHLALLGVVIYCSLSSIIVKRTVPPPICLPPTPLFLSCYRLAVSAGHWDHEGGADLHH